MHAAYDASGKATAKIVSLDPDVKTVLQVNRYRLVARQRQRGAGQRRNFAKHAQNGQAIGAIGGQLKGEQGVVQVPSLAQRSADRRIAIQFKKDRKGVV